MDPDADPRDQKVWILRIRMRIWIRNTDTKCALPANAADAANVYNALAFKCSKRRVAASILTQLNTGTSLKIDGRLLRYKSCLPLS
jgi:hypothetical protein